MGDLRSTGAWSCLPRIQSLDYQQFKQLETELIAQEDDKEIERWDEEMQQEYGWNNVSAQQRQRRMYHQDKAPRADKARQGKVGVRV